MSRSRVAVVCWNLSNNSVGRAFILADMLRAQHEVDLIGPAFQRYGAGLWPPLRQAPVRIVQLAGQTLPTFHAACLAFMRHARYDKVIVSKARLPGMLLGLLMNRHHGCPMLLDIDERETSLEPDLAETPDETGFPPATDPPGGPRWTRWCERLVPAFARITVSSPALVAEFGGRVVRHARDERVFDPARYRRDRVRAQFGYTEDDKVILFLGTARAHKGIDKIVRAMRVLRDPRAALCVMGASPADPGIRRLDLRADDRVDIFSACRWDQVPQLMQVADVVCLLQDEGSAISLTQFPAKLSDAMAMGVPVIVSGAAPLRELVALGCAVCCDEAALPQALRQIFDQRPDRMVAEARDLFLREFSYAVNRERLQSALSQASAQPAGHLAGELLDHLDRSLHDAPAADDTEPGVLRPDASGGRPDDDRLAPARLRSLRRYPRV